MDIKAVSTTHNFGAARASSAIQSYSDARPATEPTAETPGLAKTVSNVALDFAETLAQSEQAAKAAMVGDADPHALVQALAQTELAVEAAVSVRNKVVEAYQEILRMPV
jgi:flagellar hook-basal body complex protein FliE